MRLHFLILRFEYSLCVSSQRANYKRTFIVLIFLKVFFVRPFIFHPSTLFRCTQRIRRCSSVDSIDILRMFTPRRLERRRAVIDIESEVRSSKPKQNISLSRSLLKIASVNAA